MRDSADVHGKQQPGFAVAVAVMRVIMARRGGEEQAFADGKIFVVDPSPSHGCRRNPGGRKRSLWDGEPLRCGKSINSFCEEKPLPPLHVGNNLLDGFLGPKQASGGTRRLRMNNLSGFYGPDFLAGSVNGIPITAAGQ